MVVEVVAELVSADVFAVAVVVVVVVAAVVVELAKSVVARSQ